MSSERAPADTRDALAHTGITGLDLVLNGGLPRDRLYLIDGDPGTGKTTLALQFLLEGRARGESVLYITLSETANELSAVATSHGWSLDGVDLYELTQTDATALPENQYTVFHPSEVELGETTRAIMEKVAEVKPRRVVFDSLSEMRLLAREPLRYRRQILALKQLFVGKGATVLLLDDGTSGDDDKQLHSLAHGVISVEQTAPDYGPARRRIRVIKLRGVKFTGGYHDITIETGGLVVYPRVVRATGPLEQRETVSSGLPELDALFCGGLERGTTVLFLGPAGAGKSALATQYAVAAAQRNERGAVFLFDESIETYCWRAKGLGCDVEEQVAQGRIALVTMEPSTLSPGAFTHMVKAEVESGARVIVLDSLNGYLNALPQEHFLLLQLHELFMYLRHKGVLAIVTLAQRGLVHAGDAPIDMTYLADTVVLMRYFESSGSVRQAISVMKKRSGAHERTIREMRLDSRGIRVGEPLSEFQGVLTGSPTYVGGSHPLLKSRE
jgi:circadian clock protein KaiC